MGNWASHLEVQEDTVRAAWEVDRTADDPGELRAVDLEVESRKRLVVRLVEDPAAPCL